VEQAELYWDRDCQLWWDGHTAATAAERKPVASWAAFEAALRTNFAVTGEAERAIKKLLKIAMLGGESMDAYMQRAAQLLRLTDGQVQSAAAAQVVVLGIDARRFQWTLMTYRKQRMEAGNAPDTFERMRATIIRAAEFEPPNAGASAAAAAASSGHGGGNRNPKAIKVAALRRQADQLESGATGDDDDEGGGDYGDHEPTGVAAASTRDGDAFASACFKCGGQGHNSRDCSSKTELRSCHRCKKKGHIAPNCPARKQGEGAGAKSKNE
jgi:hypothetical protein